MRTDLPHVTRLGRVNSLRGHASWGPALRPAFLSLGADLLVWGIFPDVELNFVTLPLWLSW